MQAEKYMRQEVAMMEEEPRLTFWVCFQGLHVWERFGLPQSMSRQEDLFIWSQVAQDRTTPSITHSEYEHYLLKLAEIKTSPRPPDANRTAACAAQC